MQFSKNAAGAYYRLRDNMNELLPVALFRESP
jgi:hypothetical protein